MTSQVRNIVFDQPEPPDYESNPRMVDGPLPLEVRDGVIYERHDPVHIRLTDRRPPVLRTEFPTLVDRALEAEITDESEDGWQRAEHKTVAMMAGLLNAEWTKT